MKRGKQYRNVAGLIEAGRQYSVSEAVEILKKRGQVILNPNRVRNSDNIRFFRAEHQVKHCL